MLIRIFEAENLAFRETREQSGDTGGSGSFWHRLLRGYSFILRQRFETETYYNYNLFFGIWEGFVLGPFARDNVLRRAEGSMPVMPGDNV